MVIVSHENTLTVMGHGKKYGNQQILIEIFWSDEDDGYIAITPDWSGCSAFGDTPKPTSKPRPAMEV